jgi:hypothetical protein
VSARSVGRLTATQRAAEPRVRLMALMIGNNEVSDGYEAARREVAEHGRGVHYSEQAAIKYLYDAYRVKERECAMALAVMFAVHNFSVREVSPDWILDEMLRARAGVRAAKRPPGRRKKRPELI